MRIVPALDRGLGILNYLAESTGPVKASELTAQMGIPRTAIYELLNTLRERNYVNQHADGTLTLGTQLFYLGSKYAEELDSIQIAQQVATQLVLECEETVQVGVLRGRNVLYIARADPNRMVRLVSAVGRLIPAHATAIGKVLLSQLQDDDLNARLSGVELEALTSNSITDRDALERDLASIRSTGIGYDNGESNLEVNCVAAPVKNIQGTCVAAISISVPVARMSSEHLTFLTGLVQKGADQISARIGYGSDLLSDDLPAPPTRPALPIDSRTNR